MRRLALVVLCLVVMAPMTVASVAATEQAQTSQNAATNAASTTDVTLTVNVVDKYGNPISGANVTVTYGDTSEHGETYSNGKRFFDVPEDQPVTIVVEHPHYVKNQETVVENPGENNEVTLTMFRPVSGTVTVTDADGEPVDGASVRLWKTDESRMAAKGTTGADGTWETPSVEEGTYRITVKKDGYYDETVTRDLKDVINESVGVEQGTVTVDFSVIDGHLEERTTLKNSAVTVKRGGETFKTAQTDEKGKTTIALPINSQYTVVIEKDGYGTEDFVLFLNEEAKSVTYELQRENALTVTSSADRIVVGETVELTVTDEYDEPVSGATITFGGEEVATTGSDGTASVTVESAGTIQVAAANEGVTSSTVTIEGVRPADPTTEKPTSDEPTSDEPTSDEPTSDETDENGGTTTGQNGLPGFGVLVALVALGGALLAQRRR